MPAKTRRMLRESPTAIEKPIEHLAAKQSRVKKQTKKVQHFEDADQVRHEDPESLVDSITVDKRAAVKNENTKSLVNEITNDKKIAGSTRYFLMKAEPESRIENGVDVKFSIDDLKSVGTEPWDGVRNAEASKTMRERMKIGDKAFFYHSNTKTPGIAGIITICKEGYPDSSAWTKGHPYFDPKTVQEKPKWFRVDVQYERHMKRFISLRELKDGDFPELHSMQLLRRPQLSVQQVTQAEWDLVLRLEGQPPPPEVKPSKKQKITHDKTKGTTEGAEGLKREQTDQDVMNEIAYTHGA